jgi:hypothetical protein
MTGQEGDMTRWKNVAARIALVALTATLIVGTGSGALAAPATQIRWDIVKVDVVAGTVSEGGTANALANDGAKITLTGKGTFPSDPEGSTDVTGGGNWTTFDKDGNQTGTGTYTVTAFLSWEVAPGTFFPGLTDTIGDSADARAGVAVLRVAYSDGQKGVLFVNCTLNGTPPGIPEGISATKSFVNYFDVQPPPPDVSENTTLFHVQGEVTATAPSLAAPSSSRIRWDTAKVDTSAGTVSAGGKASAKSPDGSKITIVGTGTFPTGPDGSTDVIGGGSWKTFDPDGNQTGSGSFQVTRILSWEVAPGSPPPLTNQIEGAPNARAGLAVLRISYSNGKSGILVVSCRLVGSSAMMPEGINATSGFVNFFDVQPPPGENFTLFSISNPAGGYWTVASDGGVFTFGDAEFFGSTGGLTLNRPVVGMAATPTGDGYWLVASDGGTFTFGDAEFFGSTGGLTLNRPVVGMAATPTGDGYWLVASDGGIFTFGDAAFFGSTGSLILNRPIVGMAATPTGDGYWLVASDGGIFAFGEAGFFGSMGGTTLAQPVQGMAGIPMGYWMVARDGGIFSFGDASFFGSMGGVTLNQPMVGMAATSTGKGYWTVASDGGIFSFGDAAFFGSMGGVTLNRPMVGMAAT